MAKAYLIVAIAQQCSTVDYMSITESVEASMIINII